MSGQWHGGKGSAPRKNSDQKAYEDGYERIFGKRNSGSTQGDSHTRATDEAVDGGSANSDISQTGRGSTGNDVYPGSDSDPESNSGRSFEPKEGTNH